VISRFPRSDRSRLHEPSYCYFDWSTSVGSVDPTLLDLGSVAHPLSRAAFPVPLPFQAISADLDSGESLFAEIRPGASHSVEGTCSRTADPSSWQTLYAISCDPVNPNRFSTFRATPLTHLILRLPSNRNILSNIPVVWPVSPCCTFSRNYCEIPRPSS
jgi:hypothetical protein